MKKIGKTTGNPQTQQMHNALTCAFRAFAQHPFLQRLRQGDLRIEQFVRASNIRLNAAGNFVPFLQAIHAKIEKLPAWDNTARALHENLEEEIGWHNGKIDPEKSHAYWRQRYQEALQRICSISTIDHEQSHDAGVIQRVEESYGDALQRMPEEHNASFLTSAFATLEGLLEYEFKATLAYIRAKITQCTDDDILYITHHAGHEHGHFISAVTPIEQYVVEEPSMIDQVCRGIQEMTRLRTALLSMINEAIQ